MSDLTEKLKQAIVLTPELAEKLHGHDSMSSMAEGAWKPVGAMDENRRIRPILDKLLQVVEAAERSAKWASDNSFLGGPMLACYTTTKELHEVVEGKNGETK